ncbi:aldehyde dehydrogenase family protein [Streptomyces sp. bgisy034]|uniref:aldehyde dehydrogenase family protein n=1 Tax=Streptomyces sp. bgisy034 TaxID=3413774 RepID=UPI003EBEF9EE
MSDFPLRCPRQRHRIRPRGRLSCGGQGVPRPWPAVRAASELVTTALADAGAPGGAFDLVAGLVRGPGIRAVGFTGSQRGGLAQRRIANDRETVIPICAEMDTGNLVVMTRAATAQLDELSAGFANSFSPGAGQLCIKPGLLLAPAGSGAAKTVGETQTATAPVPKAHRADGGVRRQGCRGALPRGQTGPWLVDRCARAVRPDQRDRTGQSAARRSASTPTPLWPSMPTTADWPPRYPPGQPRRRGDYGRPALPPGRRPMLGGQAGRVTVDDWPTGVAGRGHNITAVHGPPSPRPPPHRSAPPP